MSDSLRGKLLIAGPQLHDPNFWRTVVLVVEHTDDGALGLVLNRPSESTVSEAVPELEQLVDPADAVYVGGPVAPGGVIVLGRFAAPETAALIAFGAVGVLRTDAAEGAELERGRAFAGHAGWGPGQLDAELERGDWFTEPASEGDAFTEVPEKLWSDVLMRKGGSYSLIARMPADPSLN